MCLKGKMKVMLYFLPVWLFAMATIGCGSNDVDAEPDYPASVTDVDGNVYNVVVIGDQAWMAENLRVSKYRNGDPITSDLNNEEWLDTNVGAYAIYPHDEAEGLNTEQEMVEAYGKLYNWYAVDDSRGLCPSGWRVPTDEDIVVLTDYIKSNIQQDDIANVLKSCRQVNSPLGGDCDQEDHPRWNENQTHHGTDDLGFNALPAGNRQTSYGGYETIGHWWTIWSSTEYGADQAVQRWIRSNSGSIFDLDPAAKQAGKSVRCIWAGE